MRVSSWLHVSLAAACLLVGRAQAINPAVHLSQYAHTAWRIQDGFVTGTPTAITQTKDGYLWIGTANGLFRFDGVRFVPWSASNGKQLLSAEVFSLLGADDGSLWIGAAYQLFCWRNGELIEYPALNYMVTSIVERRDGTIWISRARSGDDNGPICEVTGRQLKCYGHKEGVAVPYAGTLLEDSNGDLWIGSSASSGLIRWHPGSYKTYFLKGLERSKGLHGVQGLAEDPDGSLWVGLNYPGRGLGLQRLRGDTWKSFISPALNGTSLSISTLLVDRNKALLVGTVDKGLYRISAGKVDHFDSADGLSSDTVTALFQDHEGSVWIATSKGIDRFRSMSVVSFSKREGLHSDGVRSVLPAADGTIWIGNVGSLDALRGGVISSILPRNGLPGREVTSLAQDRVGRLWVGVDNALFLYRGGSFIPVPLAHRGTEAIITNLAVDAQDDLWSEGGADDSYTFSHIRDFKVVDQFVRPLTPMLLALTPDPGGGGVWIAGDLIEHFQDRHQLASFKQGADYGYIRNIVFDSLGSFWGASTGALVGWRKGKLQYLTIRNGLPCNHINTLVIDDNKALWLYAQCGLIGISRRELEHWWNNPDSVVKLTMFDALDGVEAAPSPFRPSAAKSRDGRLWFANGSLLQMIDPDHLEKNVVPPPVHVEQLFVDGKTYSLTKQIQLSPVAHNIEITYTALSFVIPQRVRFRYRLDGYDNEWQDAGSRRSAFYMNLGPGHYKFQVIACNNDGVWNETGASIDFVMPASWYQTTLFKLFCSVAAFLSCHLFYRYRMRQVSDSLRVRFDERLEERTRLARDLHDTLIQTIQGGKLVADDAREAAPDMARMRATIDLLSDWLGKAIMEGRAVLASLRVSTIEESDLVQALRRAANECCINNRINVAFSVRGESKKMHPIGRDEVFHIGHEAIQNACAHSGGAHVTIEVEYGRDLRLRVTDDGHGMDEETLQFGKRGHFGLHGRRERAQRIGAKLMLASSQNGTEVMLLVPGKVLFK